MGRNGRDKLGEKWEIYIYIYIVWIIEVKIIIKSIYSKLFKMDQGLVGAHLACSHTI